MSNPGGVDRCCMPVATDRVTIECGTYSYDEFVITACGCAACARNGRHVAVYGTFVTEANVTTLPEIALDREHERTFPDKFYFDAVPIAGQITFRVIPAGIYMPQQVVLRITDGVSVLHTDVRLTLRPVAGIVVAMFGGEVMVESVDQTPATIINFQPQSFRYEDDSVVMGEVNIYARFYDPRSAAAQGVAPVPGRATYEDDEGTVQYLQSFGTCSVVAEDSAGEPVFINKPLGFAVLADDVGLTVNSAGETDGQLWVRGANGGGQCVRSANLQMNDGFASASSDFQRSLPFVMFGRPVDRASLCRVAVYVYQDNAFAEVLRGVRVVVFTINGQFIDGYESAVTDCYGRACVTIPCGRQHGVTVEAEFGDVQLSADHLLPAGFPYVNADTVVRFESTPAGYIGDDSGPFFTLSPDTCSVSDSLDYHFKLAVTKPLMINIGLLNVNPDVWASEAGDSESKETCMVLLGIVVSLGAGDRTTNGRTVLRRKWRHTLNDIR